MNFHPRLFRQVRAYGLLFVSTVIASFLAGGLSVWQSFQLSRVIAGVFLDQRTLTDVNAILRVILGLVLLRVLFTIISEILAGRMAVKIKNQLRAELLAKINRLGPEFLKNEQTGELTTTALQGVDALDAYFSQYLPQVLVAVMLPLTILAVVFPLDLLTGIVFVLTAPLIPVFMILIGWASEAVTSRQWNALTRLGSYFLDTLQGIATLKMLGRSGERAEEVRQVSEHYRQTTLTVLRVTFMSALALELIATISTAVVAVEIGLRLLYGRIEFQQALFILLIAPDFYLPLRNLSARYHAGMTGVTAARRIFDLLDVEEPAERAVSEVSFLESAFSGDFNISIKGLSYSYPGMGQHSIRGIDLEIERGKHYALVGSSGSGKSTLARILLRFIEPDRGEVRINGMDMSDWTRDDWRRYVGWLPQTPSIFNESLRMNITLGDNRFAGDEINNAVRFAGLAGLVEKMPHGLETPLLESGTRLSGGELQRVALARVFLRHQALLIMDEPTSHLDPELERSLECAIQLLMQGRTTLTIAHRLPTIERSDEVFFIQDGVIAARGKHLDLVNSSRVYQDFMRAAGRVL